MKTMSADVQQAPALSTDKSESRSTKDPLHRRPSFHLIHKRHKDEYRKRSHQRHVHHDKHPSGPAAKRRKKDIIPPTKFLLGGNIRDPLNLNSLRDEEVNRRLNAVTPETSPMPTPQWKKGEVEVLLPPNIHDPLNLEGSESPLVYLSTPSLKRNRKKHKKKKQRSSTELTNEESGSEGGQTDGSCGTSSTAVVKTSDCDSEQQISVAPASTPRVESQVLDSDVSGSRVDVSSESSLPPPQQLQQIKEPVSVLLPPPALPPPTSLPLFKSCDIQYSSCKKGKGNNSKKVVDKIVSPVVKQPGACGTNSAKKKHNSAKSNQPRPMPNFKESNKKYQYGNYSRYYGYRNADYDTDPRLKLLESRRDLFQGKEVLDIGCNTGHVTLAIASDMGAARVVGLDLDRKLIEAARANIKHYVRRGDTGQSYPVSMPLLYGPLPDTSTPPHLTFPHNVSFVQGNYVVSSDVLVELESCCFDTILCLSVTKWFHLNWGDEGLKRAFRRMFAQLRPGGSLILEPQPWSSYNKKKNITETTWRNYQSIELFPQKFTQFLLSEVGFTKCEILGSPVHNSRGFQRPIKIFTKGQRRRTMRDSVGDRSGDVTTTCPPVNTQPTCDVTTDREMGECRDSVDTCQSADNTEHG